MATRNHSPQIEEDIEALGIKKERNSSKRKYKVLSGESPVQHQKKEPVIERFDPKTENQKKAMKYLEQGRQLTVLAGSAGTGKSMMAAYYAAKAFREGKADQIILIRSLVSTGVSIGSLPGDINLKCGPALAPILSHLEKFLGIKQVQYMLDKQIIKFLPLDFLRGSSFERKFVIAEEVQNITVPEIKSLVTRIGEDCQMVVTGDQYQNDLEGKGKKSGLVWLKNLVLKYREESAGLDGQSRNELTTNVGFVEFTNADVVRSGLCKAFVIAFNIEGE